MATYKLNLQLLNPQNLPLPNFTVQIWVKEQRMGPPTENLLHLRYSQNYQNNSC